MATLTIRNLDESIKGYLRIRAAGHGHSMEEEARRILRDAVLPEDKTKHLGSRINQYFRQAGGSEEDIVPPRSLPRPAPDFSEKGQ